MYPFQDRLSTVESFKMNFTKEDIDYDFETADVKFAKSTVCLEEGWMADLNLFTSVVKKVTEAYDNWIGLSPIVQF